MAIQILPNFETNRIGRLQFELVDSSKNLPGTILGILQRTSRRKKHHSTHRHVEQIMEGSESLAIEEFLHQFRDLLHFFYLRERMGEYSMYLKDRSPTTTQDMYKAICTFLHLELQLIVKVRHFYGNEFPSDISLGELYVIAQVILDEYPLDMFNVILMKYFDASMAYSEGNVESATILTKRHSKHIEDWHRIMRVFNPNTAA